MTTSSEDQPAELSRVRLALRALSDLRPSLDRLEAALVDRARLEECSWEVVASNLGVTKQTAHRRHAAHDPIAQRRRRAEPDPLEHLVAGPTDADLETVRRVMREMGLGSGEPWE